MNIKKKFLLKNILAISVVGIITTTVLTTTLTTNQTIANYNNLINNQQISQQFSTDASIEVANSNKSAVDGEFLLNSTNGITTPANLTNVVSPLAVTNGPRGYLAHIGNSITYMSYTGKILWQKITMTANNVLIAAHYNANAKVFVVLYSINDQSMRVLTMRETDGNIIASNNDYPMIGEVGRQLMIPILNSSNTPTNDYLIMNQSNWASTNRYAYTVRVQSNGSISETSRRVFSENATYVILSAGSILYNNTNRNYTVLLCQYGDGSISLRVFENFSYVTAVTVDSAFTPAIDNKNIDKNIREIWLSIEGFNSPDPSTDPVIHIVSILNLNNSRTKISRGYYRVSNRTLNDFDNRTINLQQPGVLDYDIHKGRIYGEYLYAYLGYVDYGFAKTRKIMRLNLNWNSGKLWNTSGFQWDDDYNNERIILYSIPYSDVFSDNNLDNIIALPFYTSNYASAPNVFSTSISNSNLYLLDGTKNAYAYNTKWKDASSTTIFIPGVGERFVKDETNTELERHATNANVISNFTQYQTNSSISITKKTSPADLIKNHQGIIPITFTINNAYSSSNFGTSESTFDMELSGFKPAATTINPTTTATLPTDLQATLPQLITDWTSPNQVNQSLQKYIFDNHVVDPSGSLTAANITNIIVESYDNLTGSLGIRLVFDKWLDSKGNILDSHTTSVTLNINGFKSINPTTLKTSTIDGQLSSVIANTATIDQLQQIIFDHSQAIFADNSIPENPYPFSKEDITNIQVVANSANNKTGTLKVTFALNNYFDTNGLWVNSTLNPSFTPLALGELEITGFLQTDNMTSIANSNVAVVIDILPEIFIKDAAQALSNDIFRTYLFENIIQGGKNPIDSTDIKAITFKPNSFNNIDGTLQLDTITLSRWYDEKSILQTVDKVFSASNITITGFKTISPTSLKVATINGGLNNVFANAATIDQLQQIIFDQRVAILADNSIPESPYAFAKENIINIKVVPNSADNKNGNLKVTFQLNNYYDTNGLWINANLVPNLTPLPLGELEITGFKTADLETFVTTSTTSVGIDILPEIFIKDASAALTNETFRNYLFNNIVSGGKDGINAADIKAITFKPNSFNNLTGTLIVENITLSKWYDEKSILQTTDKVFSLPNGITITGFKAINPTTLKNNAINGGLSTIFADAATNVQLQEIIFDQRLTIFVDNSIPENPYPFTKDNIIDIEVVANSADNTTGILQVTFKLNNYYDNNGLWINETLSPGISAPFTLEISGFKTDILETSVKASNVAVGIDILPEIFLNDVNALENTTFRNYLFDNVIQGGKNPIEASDIKSIAFQTNSFNNVDGTLVLEKITLSRWYDDKSILRTSDKEFPLTNGTITGFKTIKVTELTRSTFDFTAQLSNLLASQLTSTQATDLIFAIKDQFFVSNSLPSNFVKSNIVNLVIDSSTVNDNTGTLQLSFALNNYYASPNGAITTSPTKSFGPITISGFKRTGNGTTLQPSNISVGLENTSYPYEISDPMSNLTIKQFIFNNIVQDPKKNVLTADNIVAITLAPNNPYNNRDGNLLIASITLDKWHTDSGDVSTTPTEFKLNNNALIEISGFKKVPNPTSAVSSASVNGTLLPTLTAIDVTDEQVLAWAQQNKNLLLLNLPTTANITNISITNRISSTGTIEVSATTQAYYDADSFYTYKNVDKTFTITLNGFVSKDQSTSIVAQSPTMPVSGSLSNLLPQFLDNTNNDFKQYLIQNVIVDPTKKLQANNITDFKGDFNNLTGEYTLTSISLNQTYDEDGILSSARTFNISSFVIKGFMMIAGPTELIQSSINVSSFNSIDVLSATNEQIKTWLTTNDNFKQVFKNLPDNFGATNIFSVSIVANSQKPSTGSLQVNIVINNYFENDAKGTQKDTNSPNFNLTISGFKITSLATDVNTNPTINDQFKNILPEHININTPGFKQYLFDQVLINPQNKLNINNITNITVINFNNLQGTLTFKIVLDQWYDVDGRQQPGNTFVSKEITITNLRQINATALTANPVINKGDNSIFASAVTQSDILQIVRANYTSIFVNLPDVAPNIFGSNNITQISNIVSDDNLGQITFSVTINLYYSTDNGIIKTDNRVFNNIIISGYKKLTTEITIKSRFNITGFDSSYNLAIAESIIQKTSITVATNWLRNNSVFQDVFPPSVNNQPLNPTNFEVVEITNIDNIKGEVTVKVGVVVGNNWVLSNDTLTFYGFRTTINIDSWINSITSTTISGTATSVVDQINNIRNEIINKSDPTIAESPFVNKLTEQNIEIQQDPNDPNKYIIKIVGTTYVDSTNVLANSDNLAIKEFAVVYNKTTPPSNDGLGDWFYPVIFSVVGAIGFLILLWILIAIIRRHKINRDTIEEDETF